MKKSPEKRTSKAMFKSDKSKDKAKLTTENLFQMEEEDLALLYNDNIFVIDDDKSSEEDASQSILSKANGFNNKKEAFSKKISQHSRAKVKGQSSHKTKSIEAAKNSLFANDTVCQIALMDSCGSDERQVSVKIEGHSKKSPKKDNGCSTIPNQKKCVCGGESVNPTPENIIVEFKEKHLEPPEETENEGINEMTQLKSDKISQDLSFDLTDELIEELSDLEFGESIPEEEAPKMEDRTFLETHGQEDSVYNHQESARELFQEDESFELSDTYSSIDEPELKVEDEKFNLDTDFPVTTTSISNTCSGKGSNSNEIIEDEKFELDECDNFGTYSGSHSSHDQNKPSINEESTNCTVVITDINLTASTAFNTEGENQSNHKDNSRSNCDSSDETFFVSQQEYDKDHAQSINPVSTSLAFGKSETIQKILQAWAFGDALALSQIGQDTSKEDEPFYSGDDENFGVHKNSTHPQQFTQAEKIEHPLARYGLKVRTINAIEFVGEKNYYSLSDESRKELELLIQELSKTEEGTTRNFQLKQAIFGMFD